MKRKRQQGSITVEAVLFLPMFLFAFLTVYSMISFVRVQVILQYAADQAVREVAQYSYILEKVGILDSYASMDERAEKFTNDLESIRGNLDIIQEASQSIAAGNGSLQDAFQAGEAGKELSDSIGGYISNPEEFIDGALDSLKSGAWDQLTSYMVQEVGKSCVLQQLSVACGGGDTDKYLKSLGVSDLDYGNSSWCRNGSREVKLVVDYHMKASLPFFGLPERRYRVCASTRVWAGA